MKFKVNLTHTEAELAITREQNQLQVHLPNGRQATLHLIHQQGAHLVLEYHDANGRRQRIHTAAHRDGDTRQLWVNGRLYTYQRHRQQKTAAAAGTGSLSATIPAVVSQILVNIGDTVQPGQKLILLESMKMVIPIQAPYEGTVTAVHCQVGESIQAGIPLLELENSA